MIFFSNVLSKSFDLFLFILHSQFAYKDSAITAAIVKNLL